MSSQQTQQQTQEDAYYDQVNHGHHPGYLQGQIAQNQPYGQPGIYDQRQYASAASYPDGRPHFSATTPDGLGYSYPSGDGREYHPGVPTTSMPPQGADVYNPPLHSPGAYAHHGHYLQPGGYRADSSSYFVDARSGGPAGSPGMPAQQGLAATRPVPARLNTAPVYLNDSQHSPSGISSHSPSALRASVDPFNSSSSLSSQQSGVGPNSSLPPSSTTSAPQARPHVCEHCGLAFVRGHDLKRHLSTHSNTKPHVCECGKSFSRKDALKRHAFLKSCGTEKTSGYVTSED
ncbi:SubName: Full=Uncharacterized protein {ECO:0000313/EMBL:CCA70025.1} [Serendipita indica DSM 11827]|uniref:C2H2-type domain-containing protein n=1 Tax=Serendipita indica (strain DSM 11827) TaxID=1109443 RepID=G4TFD1_SERID|nr:SubName: Full=Uncharacterized protein {ECO:0000313/EMBL:CCA70025.1} [Serendipita indica DSM 11827]CCA70025.1 hypothetical protein PIIN_03965 [Serendipita indica DSM 11827]